MAWHDEPPRDNKDDKTSKKEKDIWSRPRNQSGAPPDLEVLLRKLKKQMGDFLSGNKGSGKKRSNSPSQNSNNPDLSENSNGKAGSLAAVVGLVLLIVWSLAGIFIVAPAEQAVILRFGKYHETVGPGPHWIPLFIDKSIVVDVDKVSDYSYSAKMLTKDENIVSVSVAIQYRIGNLKDYLFNVSDPSESLQQATASALRQVVGHSTLNEIIAEGREVWGQNLETLLNRILERYKVGIVITSVSPQPARAPEEVQDAFDDAINAQEDEKRFKEQAYAYSASVVPIAEGNAKRIITAALAYEKQVTLQAQGQTAAFLDLLPEYLREPALMKERLYLEMMENVLTKTSKIVIDDRNSKNFLYLPLESMLAQSKAIQDQQNTKNANASSIVSSSAYFNPQADENNADRRDVRTGRGN